MGSFVLVAAFGWAIRPHLPVSAASEENQRAYDNNTEALLSAYRHVEVASVSDAAEQLLGKRLYLTHRMQALFPAKFARIRAYRAPGKTGKPRSTCPRWHAGGHRSW